MVPDGRYISGREGGRIKGGKGSIRCLCCHVLCVSWWDDTPRRESSKQRRKYLLSSCRQARVFLKA